LGTQTQYWGLYWYLSYLKYCTSYLLIHIQKHETLNSVKWGTAEEWVDCRKARYEQWANCMRTCKKGQKRFTGSSLWTNASRRAQPVPGIRATKISVKNQIWTALIICPCGCNAMWKIKCAQWVCTQTAREPSNYRKLCLLSTLVYRSWCITWKNAHLWILWKSNTSHSALERAQHLPRYNGEAPHKPLDTYHSRVEPPPVQDVNLHDINRSTSSLLVSKHPDLLKLFTRCFKMWNTGERFATITRILAIELGSLKSNHCSEIQWHTCTWWKKLG
jgi:hypothetical protein